MGDGSGQFSQFQDLCDKVLAEPSHNGKTKIIKDFIESPTWSGDLYLLCKLMLTKDDQRVFHLREKSLTKLVATILGAPHNDLLIDLQKGDLAGTVTKVRRTFIELKTLKHSLTCIFGLNFLTYAPLLGLDRV